MNIQLMTQISLKSYGVHSYTELTVSTATSMYITELKRRSPSCLPIRMASNLSAILLNTAHSAPGNTAHSAPGKLGPDI